MFTVVVILVLIVLSIYLLIRLDGINREHKRLYSHLKLRDQESTQIKHLTYELAEEFSQSLLWQLQQERRSTRLVQDDLQCIEQLCQAIPMICREMLLRPQSIAQALQRYCQKFAAVEYVKLEGFINKHGRLISGWQKNNMVGYLQICQAAVQLCREQSQQDYQRVESHKTNRSKTECF